MSLDRLYEETHYLALHYHWAEEAILRLPRTKRQRYLSLLVEHFERAAVGRGA
jgi:hypothetical protein